MTAISDEEKRRETWASKKATAGKAPSSTHANIVTFGYWCCNWCYSQSQHLNSTLVDHKCKQVTQSPQEGVIIGQFFLLLDERGLWSAQRWLRCWLCAGVTNTCHQFPWCKAWTCILAQGARQTRARREQWINRVRISAVICHQVHLLLLLPQALQTQWARNGHAPYTVPSLTHRAKV